MPNTKFMIEYRKASLNDINELVRLRIEFMKELNNIQSGSNDAELKQSLLDYFSRNMPSDSFVAWLAIENDRIVGTSGLCFYTLPPSYKNISGKAAYIMNMYTVPSCRNRGIAAGLFEKVLHEAKSLGYRKVCLHATDMGKSLYLKFGFKETDNEMVLNFTH